MESWHLVSVLRRVLRPVFWRLGLEGLWSRRISVSSRALRLETLHRLFFMKFLWNYFLCSHACRDCLWHIILVAELYKTCPGELVWVATKFNVTFLPLRRCYENTRTCFSKDAENLTTYGYVLWCCQIVCTRHYSLNTVIAFYSVIEWSNFAVSVWLMA